MYTHDIRWLIYIGIALLIVAFFILLALYLKEKKKENRNTSKLNGLVLAMGTIGGILMWIGGLALIMFIISKTMFRQM